MTSLIDFPYAGRWLLTLGVCAVFLLFASSYRRKVTTAALSTLQYALNAAGHMVAYLILAMMWMWTLEPVQDEVVRIFMSLALAMGLGSLLYLQPAPGAPRQVTVANSAGILLGVLTVLVLVNY